MPFWAALAPHTRDAVESWEGGSERDIPPLYEHHMSTSSSHPETLDFYGISSSSEDRNDPEASLRSQDNRDDGTNRVST